ncbi:hypothetical protein [Marinovum algicola]|uniref:hypothetical protein n=1 Tax=Marinovum algicola TaxID=42444 RepID=UPI00352B0172
MVSLPSSEVSRPKRPLHYLKLTLRRHRYNLMLRRAELLLRMKRQEQARQLLRQWDHRLTNNMRTREVINTAFAGRPSPPGITKLRHKDFSDRLARWMKRGNLARVLWIATQFESIGKPMPGRRALSRKAHRERGRPPAIARRRQQGAQGCPLQPLPGLFLRRAAFQGR